MYRYLHILLIALLLSSCGIYKDVEVVNVGDIRFTEMGQDGIKAEVDLRIDNPNAYKVKLTESDIDVWINDAEVGKVRLAEKLTLNKRSEEDVVLKLSSNYDELSPDFLQTALSLLFLNKARFKAKGYVKGKAFLVSKKVDVAVDDEVELR
jgi:LEA14-like dessication related protein